MPKIVVLDGYAENPGDLEWTGFEELGELTVYDRTPADKILERIGDADIVYTNKTPIDRDTLKHCSQIRYIGVLATGYNVVDVVAAREQGVPVTNIPSYGTDAVGQFTIAMLLEICHHIGHHDQAVHAGRWAASQDFCFWDMPLMELAGKTMGIIGYGRIGRVTGRIARALGMRVIAVKRKSGSDADEGVEFVDLDALYAQSDVISLHCPLKEDTREMINRDSIAKMKDGVILLNSGRGQLIREADLAEALNAGKVFAAAVDVVSQEPILPDNPLLQAKNCIITPHIAWASRDSRMRLMNVAVENLRSFLEGSPENVVN